MPTTGGAGGALGTIKGWAKVARVDDVRLYSTHSLRRTQAVELWECTRNPKLVMELLGQSGLSATHHYLGLDHDEALKAARRHRLLP